MTNAAPPFCFYKKNDDFRATVVTFVLGFGQHSEKIQDASFLQPGDGVTLEHHGEEKFLHGKLLNGAVLSVVNCE